MDSIRNMMQAHKALAYVLVFGFIVLENCFGFPVYNLSKEWSFMIVAELLYLSVYAAIFAGGGLAGLFPEERCGFIVLLVAALCCAGMGCRFLLEFGEASNTYNFTVPNIALHLGTFVVISSLSWLYAVKRGRSEG